MLAALSRSTYIWLYLIDILSILSSIRTEKASDCGSFSLYFILSPYVPIHGHDEIILRSNSWHLSCMGLRLSTGSVLRAEVRGRRSKVSTTYFGSETLFISLSYWSDYATRCRPRLYQYIYTAIIGYGRPFLLSPASSAALFLGVVSISTPTGEPCNSIKLRAVTANWLYSASSGSMLLTGFTARCFIRWRRMKYKQEARSKKQYTHNAGCSADNRSRRRT